MGKTTEIKTVISEMIAAIPGGEIAPGMYLEKIGNKYIHVVDTWGQTTVKKMPIAAFYKKFVMERKNVPA